MKLLTIVLLVFVAEALAAYKQNSAQISTCTSCGTNNTNAEGNACITSGIVCPAVDDQDSVYFSLPNCFQFCQCSNGIPYLKNCADGLHFNPTLKVCDWPNEAGCTGNENSNQTDGTQKDDNSSDFDDDTSNTDSNACGNSGIACPAVDGPESVYGPLPNCSQFCQCSNGIPYLNNCPAGLHFNPTLDVCDWPNEAGCTGNENSNQTDGNQKDNSSDFDPDTSNTDNNACVNSGIVCPAVDGPDSVYGPLPNCSQFCQCSNGRPYLYDCPEGLQFNPTLNVCDWPADAGCTGKGVSGTTVDTEERNYDDCDEDPEKSIKILLENELNEDSPCFGIECPDAGDEHVIFAPSTNCSQYCACSSGVVYVLDCPPGLYFNQNLNACDPDGNC